MLFDLKKLGNIFLRFGNIALASLSYIVNIEKHWIVFNFLVCSIKVGTNMCEANNALFCS